ncbi:MerR family transcriptional regulator [Clostridium sp. YIM B02515]|uniref:MerR family transcriptional regulator n=1 Tax=Clostridium rhizosphaerae TaxID=2803861 RepID=A0ABS1T6R8_9CLOT|nr:MerR family transcriptional regulator [Clostridium rhizosphaerae]MBL4935038.1 MerR family transcriptional regulator [Clostridium rhizosphaerae]
MEYFLRGQIAKMANLSVETLRYYEKIKLIPMPTRTEKGYRLYSKDVLLTLDFIKSAKNSGFTLEQIRTLFSAGDKDVNLEYIEELLTQKLVEIGEKIVELQMMQGELNRIKEYLRLPHECPIFNSFINK